MEYKGVESAVFLKRPGRFIAEILREGETEICHVKNTGRLKELLIPGAQVFIARAGNQERKTKYDLIGIRKGDQIVNIDSQIPNYAVKEWLENGGLFKRISLIRPETKFGNSRFDFFVEADGKQVFIEVKGVTQETDGIAGFSDAPTQRGMKHIEELSECIKAGYDSYLIFVIQMKGIRYFEPNDMIHKAFGETLRKAKKAGVHILAYDCLVTENTIAIDAGIEVHL